VFLNELRQAPKASFIANVPRLASGQCNGLAARTADHVGLGKERDCFDREERDPLSYFPMFPVATSLAAVAVARACIPHFLCFFQPAKYDEQAYLSLYYLHLCSILPGRFDLVAFSLQFGRRPFQIKDLVQPIES